MDGPGPASASLGCWVPVDIDNLFEIVSVRQPPSGFSFKQFGSSSEPVNISSSSRVFEVLPDAFELLRRSLSYFPLKIYLSKLLFLYETSTEYLPHSQVDLVSKLFKRCGLPSLKGVKLRYICLVMVLVVSSELHLGGISIILLHRVQCES